MAAPTRDSLLSSELRGLAALWLHVRCCSCPYSAAIPLGMARLAAYRSLPLARFVSRLTCHSCGARPGSVVVADHAIVGQAHTIGNVATWTVDVTPLTSTIGP